MPHPHGGKGNYFKPVYTFEQAYEQIGQRTISFTSTTGEQISARQGLTRDGNIATIVFDGVNSRHGNVCSACWGYRCSRSGTRIGQCTEALNSHMTVEDH